MEKVVPNSKFVGHSTEIIWQSKIKGPLSHQTSATARIFDNAGIPGIYLIHMQVFPI